ncbi:MAG: fimbria/pilus outer membrane usher protein, partial [Janthinobacterium lividum]
LLAKGLSDFSFGTGLQRQNFALKSNQYNYFVTNADYTHGVTDYWTSSAHFESLQGQASAGISNIIQVGNLGVASASLATNIHKFQNSQKVSLSYSSQIGNINYNLSTNFGGKNYQDIYNYPLKISQSSSSRASISYGDRKFGSFFINFLSYTFNGSNDDSNKTKTISATYEKNITQASFLRFTIGTDLKSRRKDSFAYLSFSTDLEGNNLSLSNSVQKGKSVKQIGLASSMNSAIGWGYKANLIKGETNNYDIQVNKNGQYVDTVLYLYDDDNSKSQQLEFTGGVAYLNKGFYLTKSIYDSLAVVKVGNLAGIKVYNNNRKVGVTNSRGEILVPNLPSYVVSEIKLDEEKLPLDVDFASTVLKVLPKWKSGTLIDFGVTHIKSVEMILTDPIGKIIQFDQEVTIEGIEEELFIGYEGKLYINNIGTIKTIKGKSCHESECCNFSAEIDDNIIEPIIDLGKLICR